MRRLILIDIENFHSGPVRSITAAEQCYRMLRTALEPTANDQVVIAADITTITNLHSSWKGHRILVGRGRDGADLALLDVLDEQVATRFDAIALVTGDHIFAEKISTLAGEGIPTTVYSYSTSLAKRLRFAATDVFTEEDGLFGEHFMPAVTAMAA